MLSEANDGKLIPISHERGIGSLSPDYSKELGPQIDEFVEWVRQGVDERKRLEDDEIQYNQAPSRIRPIYGPPLVGKTSFAKALEQRLIGEGLPALYVNVYRDIIGPSGQRPASTAQSMNFLTGLLGKTSYQALSLSGYRTDKIQPRNSQQDALIVPDEIPDGLCLIIDGVDKITDPGLKERLEEVMWQVFDADTQTYWRTGVWPEGRTRLVLLGRDEYMIDMPQLRWESDYNFYRIPTIPEEIMGKADAALRNVLSFISHQEFEQVRQVFPLDISDRTIGSIVQADNAGIQAAVSAVSPYFTTNPGINMLLAFGYFDDKDRFPSVRHLDWCINSYASMADLSEQTINGLRLGIKSGLITPQCRISKMGLTSGEDRETMYEAHEKGVLWHYDANYIVDPGLYKLLQLEDNLR